MVKLLIENGADVDQTCNGGITALLIASSHGYFDIVKYLIEKGADLNHKDDQNLTALMHADFWIEIEQLLETAGALI